MNPGDRVKVSAAYGARWPMWQHLVGEEGTILVDDKPHDGFVKAALDMDNAPGLFWLDELVTIN